MRRVWCRKFVVSDDNKETKMAKFNEKNFFWLSKLLQLCTEIRSENALMDRENY